ncbi:Oligoribonuclease, mitochondrial [Boothiomyces sp. JEL0838]|nr:Oligoribonuclease, mitochondrial [Boothiomyces sp. JEL0838]
MLKNPLVWIDLEMTGLDLKKDRIIELACIITDGELSQIIKGPEIIINQPESLMNSMNEWCTEHHGKSGLTRAVLESKITTKEAEDELLDFIKTHIPDWQKGVLAGNSIHVDRQFLCQEMPRVIEHLHYRIIDVSTVKELSKRWYPNLPPLKKGLAHRALEDIMESIKELEYYRKNVFK